MARAYHGPGKNTKKNVLVLKQTQCCLKVSSYFQRNEILIS